MAAASAQLTWSPSPPSEIIAAFDAASALRSSAWMLGIRHCPGFQSTKVCRGVDASPRIACRATPRDAHQADKNGIAGSRIVNCLNLRIGHLIAAIREPDGRPRTGNKGTVWTIAQPLLDRRNPGLHASTLSSWRLGARGKWANQDRPGEHGSQYIGPHIIGPPSAHRAQVPYHANQ
jgi:hypothetical protein